MNRHWITRGLKIALFVLLAVTAVSFVVMTLWNWIVPAVTGWKAIDFWQAAGLLVLSRLLLGLRMGFGWGHRGHWRARMAERWQQMTPEQRSRAHHGMRRWEHMDPQKREEMRALFQKMRAMSPEQRRLLGLLRAEGLVGEEVTAA